MKKIVISNYDSLNNPYFAGGGAVVVHEIAKRLATKYEVIILTGRYKNSKNQYINGVLYKFTGLDLGPKLSQIFFIFFIIFYSSCHKWDLWIESFNPPFSTSFLPLFTKKPVIGLVQMLTGYEKSIEYGVPFDKIERIGLKCYKNFVTLTNEQSTYIKEVNKDANVTTIPNSFSDELSNVQSNKGDYLLFLGRINIKQKGLDLLLNSLSLIKGQKINLIIAGEGSLNEVNELQTLAKKNNIIDKIKFIGKVVGKEKINLISNAFCMVMPSRYEGMSLSALEAIALGKPIVCFNIDGFRWLTAEKHVLKANAYDINEYANLLKKLINDESLYKNLSNNSKQFAQQYSWDNTIKKYEQLIKKHI